MTCYLIVVVARCLFASCISVLVSCGGHAVHATEQTHSVTPAQSDVRDGFRGIFEFDAAALPPNERAAAIERAAEVVRRRLEMAHLVAHVAVERGQLVVDVAADDPAFFLRTSLLITQPAMLAVRVVERQAPFMKAIADATLRDSEAARAGIEARTEQWATPSGERVEDVFVRARDTEHESGRAIIERFMTKLGTHPPENQLIGFEHTTDPHGAWLWRTYVVERSPVLTGASIHRAVARHVREIDLHAVEIELDPAGTETLRDFTAKHVGEKLAILLDDRVTSASVIHGEISTGRFLVLLDEPHSATEQADAEQLANILESGALPARLIERSHERLINRIPGSGAN